MKKGDTTFENKGICDNNIRLEMTNMEFITLILDLSTYIDHDTLDVYVIGDILFVLKIMRSCLVIMDNLRMHVRHTLSNKIHKDVSCGNEHLTRAMVFVGTYINNRSDE